jgi:hypothetical protein
MMRFVLWWGHDSSLAITLGQLFCFGNTTVFGYRMMAVVLWWGYDSSLAIELW